MHCALFSHANQYDSRGMERPQRRTKVCSLVITHFKSTQLFSFFKASPSSLLQRRDGFAARTKHFTGFRQSRLDNRMWKSSSSHRQRIYYLQAKKSLESSTDGDYVAISNYSHNWSSSVQHAIGDETRRFSAVRHPPRSSAVRSLLFLTS